MHKAQPTLAQKITLIAAGTFAALCVSEGACRVFLFQYGALSLRRSQYQVASAALTSNSQFTAFTIQNGKVTLCPDALTLLHKDGLRGGTTIADYKRSQIKILVFGDSFATRPQDGQTWPDLLQRNLSERLRRRVGVLNYGRNASGVLHMFDLASVKIAEQKPDLALITFITDDLDRDRWRMKSVDIQGARYALRSAREDIDLRVEAPAFLIDSRVNPQWCREALGNPRPDALLSQLNDQSGG